MRLAGIMLETVSQLASLVATSHVVLEVTLISTLEATFEVENSHTFLDNVKLAVAACVTDNSRVIPPPVTLMVPVLSAPVLLAVAVILNEPLPVRLSGVTFEIVSQLTSLVGSSHAILDVTLTMSEVASDVKVPPFRVIVSVDVGVHRA